MITASLHLIQWPIECKWHCILSELQSHLIPYGQQIVRDIAHSAESQINDWQEVSCIVIFLSCSLIIFCPITNREQVVLHIFQKCSLIYMIHTGSEHLFLNHSLITPSTMMNRKQVSLHIFQKCSLISTFDWQTVRDIAHFSKWQHHHFSSYNQQGVSDIAVLQMATLSHDVLWLTGCKWHCTVFLKEASSVLAQQRVGDIP